MLTLLLLVQAVAAPVPVVGTLSRQSLPRTGCSAYLWSAVPAERRLVAMVGADAGTLRMVLGGRTVELARAGPAAAGPLGLGGAAEYRAGADQVRVEMEVATRGDLTGGALVPSGTLSVQRGDGDVVVLPVAGLVGCAAEGTR